MPGKLGPVTYLDRLREVLVRFPSRPAVIEPGRTVTYAEFGGLVRRIGHQVAASQHSRVLIHLPQTAEAYAAMFAVGLCGGYYSTTNLAVPAERRRGTFLTQVQHRDGEVVDLTR